MLFMNTHTPLSVQDMLKNTEKASALLKLIAHPHRLMILCLLLESE